MQWHRVVQNLQSLAQARACKIAWPRAAVERLEGRQLLSATPLQTSDATEAQPPFVGLNGTTYFLTGDGTTNAKLWSTNGSAASTSVVKNLGTKPTDSIELVASSNALYFNVGGELWKSDGTAANTTVIAATAGTHPSQLTLDGSGNVYYCTGPGGGASPTAMAEYNGTSVASITTVPLYAGVGPNIQIAAGNNIFFIQATSPGQQQLYVYNPSASPHVKQVTTQSAYGGTTGQSVYAVSVVGTSVYIVAEDINDNTIAHLYVSDFNGNASTGGAGLTPNGVSVNSVNPVGHNGKAYFVAQSGTSGEQIWTSDGTVGGTSALTNINTAGGGLNPQNGFFASGSNLYFDGNFGSGDQLGLINSANPGGIQLKDLNGSNGTYPGNFTTVGSAVYFTAYIGSTPTIWHTDGTTGGTVQDDASGTSVQYITGIGTSLYIDGDTGTQDAAKRDLYLPYILSSTATTKTTPTVGVSDNGGTYNGSSYPETFVSATANGLNDTNSSDFTFTYVGTGSTTYGPTGTAPTNAGSYSVVATYNGSTNYNSAMSGATGFTIAKANSSVSGVIDSGGIYTGSPFAATAASATGAGGLNDTNLSDFTFSYSGTGQTTYGPTATAPTLVGAYAVTASYKGDANHNTSSSSPTPFTISSTLSLGTLSPTQWTVNQGGFTGSLAIGGGTGPYQIYASSGLPNGLSAVVNGSQVVFTGTPNTPGNFGSGSVTIKDAGGATASRTFSIAINSALSLGALSLTQWTVNQGGFTGSLAIGGGTGPYQINTSSGVPNGLTPAVSGSQVVFTGTPNTPGNFASGSVTIIDAAGATSFKTFAISITQATPAISSVAQPSSAILGTSIADQATVSGGSNPTGTVTFNLYNNSTGTGPALYTNTQTLANGTATSGSYTPTVLGTDYWVATYNGDTNNSSTTSVASSDPVTVATLIYTGSIQTYTITTTGIYDLTAAGRRGVPEATILEGRALILTAMYCLPPEPRCKSWSGAKA